MASNTPQQETTSRLTCKLTGNSVTDQTPNNSLVITENNGRGFSTLGISFRRTVRVPDNYDKYQLPPDYGPFPLYSVKAFEDDVSVGMKRKGGVFFPMHSKYAISRASRYVLCER